MTDFLSRLAERTLGLTPRVEPLLASRYASGPATPVLPDMLDETQASAPQRPADPTQAPMPVSGESPVAPMEAVPQDAASETQATSRKNGEVANEAVAANETSKPAAALTPVLPAAMPETRASSWTESGTPPLTESLRDHPSQQARPQPEINPNRREEPAAANSLSVPAAPAAIAPDAVASDAVAGDSTARANQPVPGPGQPHAVPLLHVPLPHEPVEATRGERGLLVRPVVERAASRADAVRPLPAATAGHEEPLPSASESGPPVIRVSIGRIEVRAMLPPTPVAQSPAPAPTPPALSLDEYLKRHSGGNR